MFVAQKDFVVILIRQDSPTGDYKPASPARRSFCSASISTATHRAVVRQADVHFWHLADIDADAQHVRFWGTKLTSLSRSQCLLMTQSGHSSKRSRLFAGRCVRKLEPKLGCFLADFYFGGPQEGGNVADSAPVLNPVAKREQVVL